MGKRSPQLAMIAKHKSSFGGELQRRRIGRMGPRPLAVKHSMHLVLRSTKARGKWSFLSARNARLVNEIVNRFSQKYGVRILSMANVGNHIHLHVKLTNRFTYVKFIRAITGTIAMAVTGRSRWRKASSAGDAKVESAAREQAKLKFWDYRPFTRVVESFRALLGIRDYVRINELEGFGYKREETRDLLDVEKRLLGPP